MSHPTRPTDPTLARAYDAILAIVKRAGTSPRTGVVSLVVPKSQWQSSLRAQQAEKRKEIETIVRELEAKPRLTPTEAQQLRGWRDLLASGKMGPSTVGSRGAQHGARQADDRQFAQQLAQETAAIKRELAARELAAHRGESTLRSVQRQLAEREQRERRPSPYRGPF